MDQIAQQWPLLAGYLALSAALCRVIQSQYEARLKDWRERSEKAEARADKAQDALGLQSDLLEAQGRLMATLGERLEVALRELEKRPRARPPQ